MRSGSAAAALAAGLLPSMAMGAAAWLDVCSVDAVLEYFTCQKPVPAGCVESLEAQAMAWCSTYLSIKPVTVYVSTETPVFTEMVTETSTTTATTTEVILTTIETTSIATATQIVEETVTATLTAGGSVYKRTASTAAASSAPSCVDLTKKNLLRHPAWKLSRACSCLNPQPTTITIGGTTASATSTITATETTVVTVVVPETSVSTELTTVVSTQPVTVTSTTTTTATVQPQAPGRCTVKYTGGGNGQGNTVETVAGVTSAEECCEACFVKPNCIASAFPGLCQHLVKVTQLAGAATNDQCPLGVETYGGLGEQSPSGAIMLGPCHV